jgi:hypothetical protein
MAASGGRNVLYWYAYRRYPTRLHKVYLGTSTDLTFTRLTEVARQRADMVIE